MKKQISTYIIFSFLAFQITLAGNSIVINEIMYNSDGTDVEFVELYNVSGTAQNLQNWYLLDDNDDHAHCIIDWTLDAGEYLVIAADMSQFTTKYAGVSNINPNVFDNNGNGWSLGNGGDMVRLFDNSGNLHNSVDYNDGGEWPGSPDGNGPSLELLNPNADNSLPASWDPSSVDNGTPGEQNSVFTQNIQPICKNGKRSVSLPVSSDKVTITVTAFDNEGLSGVELFLNTGQGYVSLPMHDDGLNEDVAAGDSIYTAVISEQTDGTLVKYFTKATDNIGQTDNWPNNAPTEYHAYTVGHTLPKLRITELLAVNKSVNTDENGDYEDWFEIHNYGSESVNLNGMYIGNSMGSSKSFQLPQLNLAPDEYIIFWADNDPEEGILHVDFKLSSQGEAIALFETVDHGNVLIHGWKYGRMSPDISVGFKPEDGTAPEYLATPTPGTGNESSELFSTVCINEFQTTSALGGVDDWIELYNRGTESFDLAGCFLSDQRSNNTKWTFPSELISIIEPGEFLVIYEDVLGFSFSSEGDDVIMLTASDSLSGLDFYDFDQQQPDKSEGRFPDGVNIWQKFNEPTKGNPNQASKIEKDQISVANDFYIFPNYPNPFNPTTTIKYSINLAQHVKINIFNVNGELVDEVVDQNMAAGIHTVNFDAGALSSGVYFYKVSAGEYSGIRKMMLVK